jgi:hypothetical protein
MQNRRFIFMLFIGVIASLNLFSQTEMSENGTTHVKFSSFSNPSYFVYKGSIGNIENLKWEACFAPTLTFQLKKYPDWGLELTPQIILRMFEQFSHPVRTPSYMPKATLFYRFQKMPEHKQDLFAFFTFGHHSNGQDGLFFQSDSSTINLVNGSFATNYFLGGIILSNPEKKIFTPVSNLKFSGTYYILRESYLKVMYGKWRFFADLESNINLSKERGNIFNNTRSKSKLTSSLHLGWIGSDLINAKSFDVKRLICSYTLTYQPSFINELALFARYYYGQDYYNINFERTLKLFQFGIAIKNFNF